MMTIDIPSDITDNCSDSERFHMHVMSSHRTRL